MSSNFSSKIRSSDGINNCKIEEDFYVTNTDHSSSEYMPMQFFIAIEK
jgi:hypothetical protein